MYELCRLCNNQLELFSNSKIHKHNINYFFCKNCNSIQTEKPYWLQEACNRSINIFDTGIFRRNLYLADITLILIYLFFNKDGFFLDYAGGYGIFVRLIKDYGLNFLWEDKYSENLFCYCFEYKNFNNINIDLITAFKSFEHFENTNDEINKMLAISKNIFFSTNLIQEPFPKINEWWYYRIERGQHIFFYSEKTLRYIAQKYNLFLYTNKKDIHILSNKKLPKNIFLILKLLYKIKFQDFIKKKLKAKTFDNMNYLKQKIQK